VTFFEVVVVLALVAGVAAVAAGRVRGGLPEPTSTLPDIDLPVDAIGTKDVDAIRFSVGFRGYRMDEVDAVLDRLGLELGEREEEVRELREQLYGGGPERLAPETLAPETLAPERERTDSPAPTEPWPADPS
jgi:DivIVA domain-containing protein